MFSFIYCVVGMRFDYTHYSKNVKLNIIDLSVNKFLANKNKYLASRVPFFKSVACIGKTDWRSIQINF